MPNRRLGRIASARLGVLGGTFDPIHVGHLVVAVNVRAALGLDRTLLVVANVPWQKTGSREITKAEDRLALVEAAVAGIDGLEASRIEIDRGGPSYMVDTLTELDGREPGAELFLVIGSDVAGDLATWERVDDMRSLCTLVIVNRPGVDDGSITHRRGPLPPGDLGGWRVERVTVPNLEVSSTDLRQRARDGRPLDFLTPPAVIHCITDRGLYAVGR